MDNFYFIEGLVKVIADIIVNIVLFDNYENITIGSFFLKSRTKPREEFLTKAKV